MSRSGDKRCYPLILLMVFFLTFAGGWSQKAEGSTFTDLREALWAEQAITEMEASGVVAGYPGGGYKPYNDVTMLESVAMLIRMLGLEDQARAAEKADIDYVLPPGLNWGSGYLIMAVERGMLLKDYLYLMQPNAPATRTEVAMLAYHALELTPESGELGFDDADEISANYRDGVAAVVKSSFMQGYPGNVFKPNDFINRAQIAVLMSKIVELKYADPCPDRRASGIVSNINPAKRILTLSSTGSMFYAADCKVFLDGTSVLPDALQAGDRVNIILDRDWHAVYVKAKRSAIDGRYKGVVNSLQVIDGEFRLGIISDEGEEITRLVADNVKLNLPGGNQLNFLELVNGYYVEILIFDNKITQINFLAAGDSVTGEIRGLDSSGMYGITIRNNDGGMVGYEVSQSVEVVRDGAGIDFYDLNLGEQVRLDLNSRGSVYLIEVIGFEREQLIGIIRELHAQGGYGITLRIGDEEFVKYRVDDYVEVVDADDYNIDFMDLKEGDLVRLELDSSNEVDYIKIMLRR